MARSLSQNVVLYFLFEHVVPINDRTEQCILTAILNRESIFWIRPAGFLLQDALSQAPFDYRVERSYPKLVRKFRELEVLTRGLPDAILSSNHPKLDCDGGASQQQVHCFNFA